ncbi:MAG: hypothetical protein JW871_00380 [Endomicrobiales bacterium]|nr:hypothetical protein [Endomicrobiales bacterium]
MNLIFYFSLVVFLCLPGNIFSQEYDAKSGATKDYKDQEEQAMPNNKTLVVYYSRTGNTRRVAGDIAKELNADIEEIVDKKDRGGAKGYVVAGKDAATEKTTDIGKMEKNPADYELVIIGTPIWCWKMTPAVRTYIEKYKEDFKEVAFFTTSGGMKPDKIAKSMEELAGKKGLGFFGVFEKDLKDKNKDIYKKKVDDFINIFLKTE